MKDSKNYIDPYLDDTLCEFEVSSGNADWMKYVLRFKQHWKYICIATLLFSIVGAIYALSRQHTWKVTVTLAPEVQSNVRSGTSLKNITSLLGVGNASLANSTDALNITLAPEICASTPFLVKLFDVEVNPEITEEELENGAHSGPMSLYTYLSHSYMTKKAPCGLIKWIKTIFRKDKHTEETEEPDTVNIAFMTEKQAGVVGRLQRMIQVEVDSKSGVTAITVSSTDPVLSTQLADTVSRRLQDYISDYRIRKAKQDFEYYHKMSEEAKETMIKAQAAYAHSVDFDRSVILKSVSSEKERLEQEAILAQQLYSQMKASEEGYKAKIQELRPIFAVIQPAQKPQFPADSRKKMVAPFVIVGFLLATVWKVLIQYALRKI